MLFVSWWGAAVPGVKVQKRRIVRCTKGTRRGGGVAFCCNAKMRFARHKKSAVGRFAVAGRRCLRRRLINTLNAGFRWVWSAPASGSSNARCSHQPGIFQARSLSSIGSRSESWLRRRRGHFSHMCARGQGAQIKKRTRYFPLALLAAASSARSMRVRMRRRAALCLAAEGVGCGGGDGSSSS